jgi:S1-C subfamily serine protease
LIVVGVQPQGPAEKAGIVQGDVLVSLDGHAVSSVSDLQAVLDEERIGRELRAQLVRVGRPLELGVTVSARA